MKRWHIALDTHSAFCQVAVVNAVGDMVKRARCETTLPDLLQVVERAYTAARAGRPASQCSRWSKRGAHMSWVTAPIVAICTRRRLAR